MKILLFFSLLATVPSPASAQNDPQPADADAVARALQSLEGYIIGVGMVLEEKDGSIRAVGVPEGGPADRAGIRPDWEIARINSISTKGMALADAMKLLRGEAGSEVRIEAIPPAGQPRQLTLTREKILLSPMETRRLDGGILWLRPNFFDRMTPGEILSFLQENEAAKGAIIDLRKESYGATDPMAEVLGMFLPADSVLWFTRETNGNTWEWKRGAATPNRLPFVLLVGPATSHSGELFASALQRNGRARVIGAPTAGIPKQMRDVVKGDAGNQTFRNRGTHLLERDDRITNVTPDILLPDPADDDVCLTKALAVLTGNATPPKPLPWTSTDGRTIQAVFVRLENDAVVVLKDGKESTIPFARLSPASIEQAKRLNAAQN